MNCVYDCLIFTTIIFSCVLCLCVCNVMYVYMYVQVDAGRPKESNEGPTLPFSDLLP